MRLGAVGGLEAETQNQNQMQFAPWIYEDESYEYWCINMHLTYEPATDTVAPSRPVGAHRGAATDYLRSWPCQEGEGAELKIVKIINSRGTHCTGIFHPLPLRFLPSRPSHRSRRRFVHPSQRRDRGRGREPLDPRGMAKTTTATVSYYLLEMIFMNLKYSNKSSKRIKRYDGSTIIIKFIIF